MNTFIRFFYEFISIFFEGIGMVFGGLFNGIIKMFNFTEYLNNLYVKTQMYHFINKNDITKALMNKGFNIEFYTKDVMKIRK